MRVNRLRFKRIMIIAIVCIALYFTIYPLYIKWIAGNYAKKFSDVLNSHDMEMYDNFFSKDTIFEFESSGRQIKYIDAKKNMEKMQAFTSKGSYGHLEEWFDFKEFIMNAIRKEYCVYLRLPISDYQNGENIVEVGIIEGEMILKRKWMFFFDIEKVTFYVSDTDDDDIEFLEDFLGI